MNRRSLETCLWLVLIAAGIFCRVAFRSIPNFTPVAAIALFSGYYFSSRWIATTVPLAIMAGSDLFLGGYAWQTMIVVYAFLTLPVIAGNWLRSGDTQTKRNLILNQLLLLLSCSVASSVLFFVFTNLAWWTTSAAYECTFDGLMQCYLRAIPFFRYTLAGDLFFASLLFGSYSAVRFLGWQAEPKVASDFAGK